MWAFCWRVLAQTFVSPHPESILKAGAATDASETQLWNKSSVQSLLIQSARADPTPYIELNIRAPSPRTGARFFLSCSLQSASILLHLLPLKWTIAVRRRFFGGPPETCWREVGWAPFRKWCPADCLQSPVISFVPFSAVVSARYGIGAAVP